MAGSQGTGWTNGMLGRLVLMAIGLVIFSFGLVLNLQANVGLAPWQAFSVGVTLHSPLTFGQANTIIGAAMVGLSWLLGVRPGIATLLNIVVTALMVDFLLARQIPPRSSGGVDGYAMLLLGTWFNGIGTSMYVKGEMGAGPRDSFMLGLAMYLGGRVGPSRNLMDISVTGFGWLLGAPIGLGTLVYALVQGPVMAYCFRMFRVPVRRRPVRRKAAPWGSKTDPSPPAGVPPPPATPEQPAFSVEDR